MKDEPGAYGIVLRNKKQNIPEKEFKEVCEFFLKENFRLKAPLKKGEKFDILVTEVRFVQPIKGDKLGRVRYSKEKVMTVRMGGVLK